LESVRSGLCTIEGYKSQKVITFTFKGNNGSTFNNLNVNYIRMYIKNNLIYSYNLLHALTKKTKIILLSDENNTIILPLEPKECLQSIGLSEDEGLLDTNEQFLGYRLLTEFFYFIEKFLFLAIKIPKHLNSNVINLSFIIEDFPSEIEPLISTENFSLTATPIINLFKVISDPISIDQNLHKYKVIPDKLNESMIKVCDIQEVHAIDQYGNKKYIAPLYGINHYDEHIDNQMFWVANKYNNDMYISIVDLNNNKCNQKFDFGSFLLAAIFSPIYIISVCYLMILSVCWQHG
jgi:type VI secretion system protein ImpG